MKISIVVATYNGEKYLLEQLNSFINQTVLPNEIIISDDNSEDSTMQIAQEFAKICACEVKIIKNKKNHGVTGNFQNAAKEASGDIVFFSDQDDVWYKNKIAEMLKCFDEYPDCIGAFCDADCVDLNLNKLNATFNDECWSEFKKLPFNTDGTYLLKGNIMVGEAIKGNILGGCCLAIKNEYLSKMFDFCPTIYHDDWLCFCMFNFGDVVALNKSLFAYRLHGNNTVGFKKLNKAKDSKMKFIIKTLKKVNTLERLFTTEADRAIYFREFSEKYNSHIKELDMQTELVKRNIIAATSSKHKGIKLLKQIYIELNQYKSMTYYQKILYVLLHTKRKRQNQLEKYIKAFEKQTV